MYDCQHRLQIVHLQPVTGPLVVKSWFKFVTFLFRNGFVCIGFQTGSDSTFALDLRCSST
jgi:hypothetical protein